MTIRASLARPRALSVIIVLSGLMSGGAIAASGVALSNTTRQAHVACVTVDKLRSDLVTVLTIARDAPQSKRRPDAQRFYADAIRRLQPIRCG